MNKYPGDGYYYVLCDICGKKMRAKDATLITDKYNLHHNLLVCKADVDETNPQQYIRAVTERQIDNPKLIRSEGTDVFVYIDTPSQIESGDSSDPSGITPSSPIGLTVIGASAASVELEWQGPLQPGSGAISGYKIERESPVGGGFSTLTANTGSVARYYNDDSVSASTQYNYRVSAINKDGTGSASNEASITTNS